MTNTRTQDKYFNATEIIPMVRIWGSESYVNMYQNLNIITITHMAVPVNFCTNRQIQNQNPNYIFIYVHTFLENT